MKANTSKERNFYTQGQRLAARILFILWLLASVSPEGTLATPKRQPAMVPATTTSPGEPSLAITLPSLPPGGILQLPPDSPGSLWSNGVASSLSIDAVLQRQRPSSLLPRTIGKPVCRFWSPRTQETPRTQARPVAEGDEAKSSGSQHPAVAPSDAIITSSPAIPSALQQLMSPEGVPDNDTLLAALDAAPPQEQRLWLEEAIKWFADQKIEALGPAAIRDYAFLAHVQVTPENKELLKRYFNSLCNKVKDGSFGEELLIQALVYVLAHIDPTIFAGNPQPLLDLGTNLLAKLNPSQREFKQADYPSARASLEALFQALFLAKEVAPGHLNVREGGLYQSFRDRLQEIIDRAQYYPVRYQSRILMQILHLLEAPEPDREGNMRRIAQGLLGAVNLVAVGQGLATGELRPAELQEGIALLQRAFAGQRIQPEPWYSELLSLEEAMLRCLEGGGFRFYPEPEELVQRAKDIPAQCRRRERLGALVGSDKINQYKQALRFGIAMQLSTLSLCGPTPAVRQGSIERLRALGQPKAWGSDTNVLAGLLDGLALVAVQSQAERAAEAAMARAYLEALAYALPTGSSQQSGMLKRLVRPQSPQDDASRTFSAWLGQETLPAKLQRLREQTTQPAPSDKERLLSHVKGPLRRTATIESFKAQEVANISQLGSYILLAKLSHFVERIAITEQLSVILSDKGVCVLHGFGGAGKSTLAAHYGHGCKATQTVRWIGAENSSKLKEGYEQLAQELQVAYQPLAKKLTGDASQYRQELARMVYSALEKSSQPTLLILDNAQDASLVADYLLHRPDAIQAIITTRSAEAFEGTYEQLQLGAFSQGEGEDYLEVRLKEMKRAYTPHEVVSLLEEVGLVAQKLNLAAGYLQANKLVKAAQYIARLQALKQGGTKQQGKLTLPEVALGLETLTKEGQQLMQYAAYLDADFIPLSLVSVLLGEEDPEQLSEVVRDLSRLSLMQVISTNEGQELGLQVHREVQASCREYEGWSTEAALGSRGTILSRLTEVLEAQMPWVKPSPDERWQRAKLYAPHVATVVSKLSSSDTKPSAVVARLLGCMGQYSKEVALNYSEALEYQQQAFQIYQNLHKGDHPDVARALSEIGTTQSRAGQLQEALENKLQVLEMRKRLAKGQDDPEVAYVLNSAGEILTHLGRHQEALEYKQEGLAMRKRLFPGDHPDVARSLISVGIGYENLERLSKALASKQEALAMRERLTPSQGNTDIAHSLQNVGETEIKIGKAEQGLAHCQQGLAMRKRLFKDKDHPNIAQSLYGVGLGYAALGDYQQATAHYQQAVEMALRVFKGAHQDLTKYCHHLIETLPKLQEEQVQQIKTALVPLCSEALGAEHALTKDLLAASTES